MEFKHRSTTINKDLAVCFGLCVCSFLINTYFTIPIYGSVSIYVGSIIALLSLLVLPLSLSILVLICNLTTFYFQVGVLEFAIIQAVEFTFVYLFIRYRHNFLLAVLLFWIALGLPVMFSILYTLVDFSLNTAFFIAITICLNGFVCGVFALLIYWFIPNSSQFRRFNPPPPKFTNVVFELCLVSVVLPIILVTLVFTWRSTEEAEALISKQLVSASAQLENALTNRLGHNLQTIVSTGASIQTLTSIKSKTMILNAVANSNRDIETIVVSDAKGIVQLAAPEKHAIDFTEAPEISVASRPYYLKTKNSNTPQVSQVLKAIGVENIEIVVVTSPLQKDAVFSGMIQANIVAGQLIDEKVNQSIERSGIQIIVTDETNAIIYSSADLNLHHRSEFKIVNSIHPFLRHTPVFMINNQPFIYQVSDNEFGWNIYTVASPSVVFSSIVDYFLFIGLTILGSVILVAGLANMLATKITIPLVNLEKYFASNISAESLALEATVSREMVNVTHNFVMAHELSLNFQEQLKEQVADKTKELITLNKQLEQTAQRDALTGLYNRGAFDQMATSVHKTCVRNKLPFTLAIVDIDKFKNVNDTYGHQAGDKCIIEVAHCLQRRCLRDTDLVARYGGEEYVLLLSSSNVDSHQGLIESIHTEIAEQIIVTDKNSIQLTVSIGIVTVSKDFSNSFEQLISLSDEQLYKSKNGGRNKISYVHL